MDNLAAVEEQTRRIGTELFTQVKEESVRFFRSEQWTARLLEWAMRHEAMKVKLFRFVDVLPTLGEDTQVVRHLEEYFGGGPDPFRGLLKMGLSLAGAGRWGARAAAATLRKGVEQVARSFIAGTTIDEIVTVVEEFYRQGQGTTIDVLGEATLSEAEADAYQQRYLDLLSVLIERSAHWPVVAQVEEAPWGRLPRINLSVKLSAFYSQLDPIDPEQGTSRVMERLSPLLQKARAHNVHIQIDMEDYHLKDLTLHLLRHIGESPPFRDYRHLGVALQAYLRESEIDAQELIAWARRRGTPITVRLVKGAYWDFEVVHARLEGWPVPVYEQKWETDASFERLTRLFLENHDCIDLAIGSHNIRSIAHALALVQALDLPPRSVEFQVLYGMAAPLRRALSKRG
ncbi:MAG: L-glutamate gamma-semialdehyde dehydrogenase, partial [Nitrospinota bacterium]